MDFENDFKNTRPTANTHQRASNRRDEPTARLGANENNKQGLTPYGRHRAAHFMKLFSKMVINDLGAIWGEETSFSVARKSDQSRAHVSQSSA
jgi:hypothetical protein